MVDDVFGRIVTGDDVRAATIATLQRWVPTYLAVLARKSGRVGGDLPDFASYATLFDVDKYEEDIMPACVVAAPGLIETPRRESGGYRCRWGVGIGPVVSGQDTNNTYQLAALYTAAVRSLMLQHASLGGFADGVVWVGERYDNLSSDDLRTIAAGVVQFSVEVANVVDPLAGPTTPTVVLNTPVADWPIVQTIKVQTEKEL